VALISLLAGFRGNIGGQQILILLLEGAVLLGLWADRSDERGRVPAVRLYAGGGRVMVMLMAVLTALVGSVAAALAARGISDALCLPGAGLVTSLMLAPAAVLPMVGWGASTAHQGRQDQVVTTLVGYVLINVCAILPIGAALWMARPTALAAVHAVDPRVPTTMPATTSASTTDSTIDEDRHLQRPPLPYPMGVWRLDTVLLIAAGLFLLPVALGRWNLGVVEGYVLLLSYVAYMVLTMSIAR
jgi:hypothetical protein